MGQLWVSGAHFGVGNGVEASESSRTLDTADSGNRIPPTLLVGATIFSTSTRSSRGIRRLAISGLFAPCEVMTSRARRLGRAEKSKPSDSEDASFAFSSEVFLFFARSKNVQVRRTRAGRGPQLEAPLAPDGLKQHRLQLACLTPSTYLKGARTTAVGFATRVFRAVTRRGLRSRRSAIANPRVRRTAPRARRSTRSRSGRDARSFGSRRAHSRPSSPFPSPRPSSCAVSPVNARR